MAKDDINAYDRTVELRVCNEIADRLKIDFVGEKDFTEYDDPLSAITKHIKDSIAGAAKGHTVLAREGDNALIFTSIDEPTPYVIACGYNEERGDWASGLYRSDLGHAWDEFRPEIIENATIRWKREDFEQALENHGIEPSEENVQLLINDTNGMAGWRDYAVETGNEMLGESAACCPKLQSQNQEEHDDRTESYDLGSQAQDMRAALNGLDSNVQNKQVDKDER